MIMMITMMMMIIIIIVFICTLELHGTCDHQRSS
jgi:hypothetical protein